MRIKHFKAILYTVIFILLIALIMLFFPTWTPKISGNNSISELRQILVNGTKLEIMIRGEDKTNPVIIFAHGGPGCTEIPYVKKYQESLEKDFVVVHYDQRASGKSYHFSEDYSNLSANLHVADLLELTDYIRNYLGQEKVILTGHSYGTYIGIQAASLNPEKFTAYIGIGQMSNVLESEIESLNYCMSQANMIGNTEDVQYLNSITSRVTNGEMITPRDYVRKYGGTARLINDVEDINNGLMLSTEYNLLDVLRYNKGVELSQELLIHEVLTNPLSDLVTEIKVPCYFILGKYDYMTSAISAKKYFDSINTDSIKEFILYENSAHYPHFEEEDKYTEWMYNTFKK